jgi:hypothetical protein
MGWIIEEGQEVVNHKPVVSSAYHFESVGLNDEAFRE